MRILFLLAAFSIIAIDAAQAQTAEFSPPTVGTKLYTDAGGSIEVTNVDGLMVTAVNKNGRSSEWLAGTLFSPPNSGWTPLHAEFDRIWPLTVGKQIEFTASGTNAAGGAFMSYETISVVRTEKLPTEAGTFDTFVIEHRERSARGTFEGLYTYYYAPQVHFPIKASLQVIRGSATPWAWKATKIDVPKTP